MVLLSKKTCPPSSARLTVGVVAVVVAACGTSQDSPTDAGARLAADSGPLAVGAPSTEAGARVDAGVDAGVMSEPAPPPNPCPEGGPCAQWQNVSPPGVNLDYVAISNYGMLTLAGAEPDQRSTLYVGTCNQGVWKTTDGADTWTRIDTGKFYNNDGTIYTAQGDGGNPIDSGRNWTMAVDPTDSNVVYTCPGYGFSQSLWKSTNGGVDWKEMIGPVGATSSSVVYTVNLDPLNHLHLLVSTVSWVGYPIGGDAGLLESMDGGNTWTPHPPTGKPGGTPSGWGHGQFVFFVGQKDDGSPDTSGQTWIVSTQGDGIWRTTDGSQTWSKVADFDMTHGQESMYRSQSTGALFLGGISDVFRSTDNGQHWAATGAQSDADGYGGIVGDGSRIYAMLSNTGVSTAGPYRWQILPEADVTSSPASSNWTFYNQQMFNDGPVSMVFDPAHDVVYASMWCTGLWRLRL